MKFENIDLVDALRRIMDIHTQNYKEDFELDAGLLHSLAGSQYPEDKRLLWMSRPNGTYPVSYTHLDVYKRQELHHQFQRR